MKRLRWFFLVLLWVSGPASGAGIDPDSLGLADPRDLGQVLAAVQARAPAGTVPEVSLRSGDYQVHSRIPIWRPLVLSGQSRQATRVLAGPTQSLVVGYLPESESLDPSGRWRAREADGARRWLGYVAGPLSLGRIESGWAEVRRWTVRLRFLFPGGRVPRGTFVACADTSDRPHLIVTHWGEGEIGVRTTTLTREDREAIHDWRFSIDPASDRLDLELFIDPEGGKFTAVAGGKVAKVRDSLAPVNQTRPVPLRPGSRLRGALIDAFYIGAVPAGGSNRDVPGAWSLPEHGPDYDFVLVDLSMWIDDEPLVIVHPNGDHAKALEGSGAVAWIPAFDLGPENQVSAQWGGGVSGVTFADLSIRTSDPWATPIVLARALDFRMERVDIDCGASGIATLPYGATWSHMLVDCQFTGGWDAAVHGSDSMTLDARRVTFAYPGRHCVRGQAARLRLLDCRGHAPRARNEHIIANFAGENGWITVLRDLWWDDESTRLDPRSGLPYFRSLVYHEASLHRANLVHLADCETGVSRPRFALAELVVRPGQGGIESYRASHAQAERCQIDGGVPLFRIEGPRDLPVWSTSADVPTRRLNPSSPVEATDAVR